MNAGVTVALLDFSPERAQVIRELNQQGIQTSAWLLARPEEGYFATADNAEVMRRYVDGFLEWSHAERLQWERVGLDFEPDLHELQRAMRSPVSTVARWVWRARKRDLLRAQETYRQLFHTLETAGYETEGYQFHMVIDDQVRHTTGWQRLLSVGSTAAQVQTFMLYSSLMGPIGEALMHQYAPRVGSSMAVGSTGGGIDPLPKLTWAQLQRDLLIASQHSSDIRVFSLEGCVEQGFLDRLVNFDWQAPCPHPGHRVRTVGRVVALTAGLLSRIL